MKKIILVLCSAFCMQFVANAQEANKFTIPKSRPSAKFGGSIAQHIGTSGQESENSPFLFFKNGQSAGLDLTIAPKAGTTRFKIAADYIIGTADESAIAAYAKQKDITYSRFTIPKPRGFSLMASPQFMLFPKSKRKKAPLVWLDFKAGAVFSNQEDLQFFQGQTTPSKEIKSKAVSFVYSPSVVVNVIKTKKIFLNLKAGYSNYGGIGFGVSITEQDCRGAPCFRCQGVGCNGPMPEPPKGK
jgi:hypothetical protein